MKDERVYITRDTYYELIHVWPATRTGIRKFHGCVQFGTDTESRFCCKYLTKTGFRQAELITPFASKDRYGFVPRKGQAYYWNGKKAVKVELEFSN